MSTRFLPLCHKYIIYHGDERYRHIEEAKRSGTKNLDGKSLIASGKSLISSFVGTITTALTVKGTVYGFGSY